MGTGRFFGLMAVCLASPALADSLPLTLIWQAPEGCPQYDEVWSSLTERLGRTQSRPDQGSFAARGVVTKVENGFRVELQTLNASGAGTRQFNHPNCEELTRLSVVALSVAIDPQLESPPEVVARSLWLGVGPLTTFGVLPFFSAGLSANASVLVSPAAFELSLQTALPQLQRTSEARAVRVALPIGGGVAACLGLHRSRWSLQGCASLQLALLTAEAMGVELPRLGQGAFLCVGPRAQGRLLVHERVALRLSAEAGVALIRPGFVYADGVVAHSPSQFSFAGALAAEFRLW